MTQNPEPATGTEASQAPQLDSGAVYEWLLSDHPDARAERSRRRAAACDAELKRAQEILRWSAKVAWNPDAPKSLRDLAGTMAPLAASSVERTLASISVPDTDYVAQARADWENFRRADDPDYRYPARYTGEAAASQPVPDPGLAAKARQAAGVSDPAHRRAAPAEQMPADREAGE